MENMKCGEVRRSRVWRGEEVESVEKEWEKFRDIIMECTNDICGMRRDGEWTEKKGELMAE